MYGRMRHAHPARRGPGRGGFGPGPGRHRARRGAIRDAIIQLLGERPMHGYELIGEIATRSGGRWKPSPGSVYPTLSQLEDLGLVSATETDGRKQYALTDAGRSWRERHRDAEEPAPWDEVGAGGRGDLRRLAGEMFGQLRQIGQFGSVRQLDQARTILARTRTELYQVLATPDPEPQADAAAEHAADPTADET